MNRESFLKGGWFTPVGSFLCFFSGILIVGLVLWTELESIALYVGLVLGTLLIGIAGYESRARALGLAPPFTSDPLGWRKAKQSYETSKDAPGEKSVDD